MTVASNATGHTIRLRSEWRVIRAQPALIDYTELIRSSQDLARQEDRGVNTVGDVKQCRRISPSRRFPERS